jgi:hypothetical protein
VDVHLAVDFLAMAMRGDFEVGIIFSHDTDLKPALEVASAPDFGRSIICEIAAWLGPGGARRGLRLEGKGLQCHYLDQ